MLRATKQDRTRGPCKAAPVPPGVQLDAKEKRRRSKAEAEAKRRRERRQKFNAALITVAEEVRGKDIVPLTRDPSYRDGDRARRYNTDGGVVPLDVMVKNMRFAHQRAEQLTAELDEWQPDTSLDESENQKALSDKISKMLTYRAKAQEFAVDAAPYMHPKLASVALTGDEGSGVFVKTITRKVIGKDGKPVQFKPLKNANAE